MKKNKFYRLVTSLLTFFVSLTSTSNKNNIINEEIKNSNSITEVVNVNANIDDIIDNSIDEINLKLDDYIDVDYFTSLVDINEYSSVKYSLNDNEIDEEQYNKVVETVSKLTAGVVSIANILSSVSVSNVAIITIKASFNTMLAAIKAFFTPTVIKVVIITTALLALTTTILINWNKIKSVFNKIVDVFKQNAGSFVSTVVKVFNNILNAAKASAKKDISDTLGKNKGLSDKLKQLGKSVNDVEGCLKEFLSIATLDRFYNSNDKVLCIGRDPGNDEEILRIDSIYRYNNYATSYGFWKFYVKDFEDKVGKYTLNLINLVNDILIYYCIYNDWDFVLVTNPYYYMKEHKDLRYGGYNYSNEISIIRNHSYNRFLNVSLTWNTIKNPGYRELNYYALAGYRVSK